MQDGIEGEVKAILKSYLKVFVVNILVALFLACISMWITDDKSIADGFIIGSLCRCAGVLSIVKTSRILIESERPRMRAMGLYVLRYGFYGAAIAASLKRGVNGFSLLAGFLIFDIIIYFTHRTKPAAEA